MSSPPMDQTGLDTSTEQDQLEQLRDVILGPDHQLISDTLRDQARELVSEVVTEAIHDRQRQDGSINNVLLPIVESSVDTSVSSRGDKMVSSLYPLVGSLVRKAVSAFLTDFMEKTNQLLENSLTVKGLKWRFKAWQSGVSFAQYVASQTFVYRVEHVLLIHRETGLLLNTVEHDAQSHGDADLISSMLSAINDFVGDSFGSGDDGVKEDLNTVTTDNFNLLIKAGPQVLVVAAVTGNPPQSLADRMQLTLEDIHKLYEQELSDYNGDSAPFENAEQSLRHCLLSEQKQETETKPAWMAWIFVSAVACLLLYASVQWWQTQVLLNTLSSIDQEPGIVLNQLSDDKPIQLHLLRDPNAISVDQWLNKHHLSDRDIEVHESGFRSLDLEMTQIRVAHVLGESPELSHQWRHDTLYLRGNISPLAKSQLLSALKSTGLVAPLNINTEGLLEDELTHQLLHQTGMQQQVFDQTRGKIGSLQLDFAKGSDLMTPAMLEILEQLVMYFEQLKPMSSALNVNFGLLIIGVSDNSGSKATNDSLSARRAANTQQALLTMGLTNAEMYTSGLGQIDMSAVGKASRKVLFNVLYIEKSPLDTKDDPQ